MFPFSIRRLLPFILLSGLLGLLFLGMMFVRYEEKASLSASISGENPRMTNSEERLVAAIQEHDFGYLLGRFHTFDRIKDFLDTLQNCRIIQNVLLEDLDSGFWLSFQCATTGDSLHPYFGFFQTESPAQVFWGQNPRGKILSARIQRTKKVVKIENLSEIPWSMRDTWQNSFGETVNISAEHGASEVHTGEVATFVTTPAAEISFLENRDHGFYVELE